MNSINQELPIDFSMSTENLNKDDMKKKSVPRTSAIVRSLMPYLIDVNRKVCRVCGDKAIGCNFGVVSCESCKAFFRRMAFRVLKSRCKGHCDVNKVSRIYCKKCRLMKCFRAGMDKNLVFQINSQAVVFGKGRKSDFFKVWAGNGRQRGKLLSQQRLNTGYWKNNIDPVDVLSNEDRTLITGLNAAYTNIYNNNNNNNQSDTNASLAVMADKSVHNLIKVTKGIDDFWSLEIRVQIELLKNSVIEILVLLSVPSFSARSGSYLWLWLEQNSSIHESGQPLFALYAAYSKLVKSLNGLVRRDNNVIYLLATISLFTACPGIHALGCSDAIFAYAEKYAGLLNRYVKTKHSSQRVLFPHLMMELCNLQCIKEHHRRVLATNDTKNIEPLFAELFNLQWFKLK
ncbi:nuclear receptor subfamily 1 group I member 3-like [Tubulanus polymorphus]|uniref:nuclear receptor subfamily 1 group I member 3-like n=1 Tax=Tubulanus polymorphus TaxID=672921 RepID=UPI003DA533DF